jgi:iron complex transport system ATP-binding protein
MLLKDGGIYAFGKAEEVINRHNLRNVFHSDVFVGKNPVTGKIYVSPVFDPGYGAQAFGTASREQKKLKVHIIGGGGAASPVINLLHHHGYQVSCGVVNTFDSDLHTCEMLDIPYIVEAPFSPISLNSQNKNLEFIKASDAVILPEVEFGNGNFSNLVSVKEALALGKEVIVVDCKNIDSRDHTGGKAGELYRKIIGEGAKLVSTHDQILELFRDLNS